MSTDTKMLQLPAAALVICVYASLRHNDISSGKQNNLTICQNNYLLLLHCLDYLFMNDMKGGITLRVHLTPDGPIAAKLHSLSANGCV